MNVTCAPPHPAVRGHPHPAAPSGPHKHLQSCTEPPRKGARSPEKAEPGGAPRATADPSITLRAHVSAGCAQPPWGTSQELPHPHRGHGRDRGASRTNPTDPRCLGSPGAPLAAGADRRTQGHLWEPQSTVSLRKAALQESSGCSRLCSHLPVGVPTLGHGSVGCRSPKLAAGRLGTFPQRHTRGTEPGRGSPGRDKLGRGHNSPSNATCGHRSRSRGGSAGAAQLEVHLAAE